MEQNIEIAKSYGCTPVNGWEVIECPFITRTTDVGSYIVTSHRILMSEFIKLYHNDFKQLI